MSIHFLVACVLSFKLYIKKFFFGIRFLTHRNQNCIHFNKPCMTLFTNKFHTTKTTKRWKPLWAQNHLKWMMRFLDTRLTWKSYSCLVIIIFALKTVSPLWITMAKQFNICMVEMIITDPTFWMFRDKLPLKVRYG